MSTPATRTFSSIVKEFASSEMSVSVTVATERKRASAVSKAESQRILRETRSTVRRMQARDCCSSLPSSSSLSTGRDSGPLTPTSTRKSSVAVAVKIESPSDATEPATAFPVGGITPVKLEAVVDEEVFTLRRSARKRKGSTVEEKAGDENDADFKDEDDDVQDLILPKSLKKKRNRTKSYAPPEMYAHLNPLPDSLADGLIVMIVGINPGVQTALAGHAFANPGNKFWKLMHTSGLTDRKLDCSSDKRLPELYSLGITNLVSRPTSQAGELSHEEQVAATAELEAKVARHRPEAVFLVGKSIWEKVFCYRHGRLMKKEDFKLGWQDERMGLDNVKRGGGDFAEGLTDDLTANEWEGARIFVAVSTSGLNAAYSMQQQMDNWNILGRWVQRRRKERGEASPKTNAVM
ncbi:hypothetical protein HK101_005440 [Irineochytrium annulatum]|nr:hypothetical protein HK101_005440 [Irineochytrium annulatum]